MGFTTPCFIRKNTKELRDKLESIGYKNCISEDGPYIFTLRSIFDCMYSECGLSDMAYNGLIDCGTNEELFLSIAAMRDDSDINQWFVLNANVCCMSENFKPKGSFILCKRDKWFVDVDKDGEPSIFSSRNMPARKATVKELIEHFK